MTKEFEDTELGNECSPICRKDAEWGEVSATMRHIRERLDKGDARFERVESILDRLVAQDNKLLGGYKLFVFVLSVCGTVAAILSVPWGGLFHK